MRGPLKGKVGAGACAPAEFISARVLGEVLGAGLHLNLTELINLNLMELIFVSKDTPCVFIDLDAPALYPQLSASDFCLHICHVHPFFIACLPAKNSLPYLKAGSFS